jgi:hypothetical protein
VAEAAVRRTGRGQCVDLALLRCVALTCVAALHYVALLLLSFVVCATRTPELIVVIRRRLSRGWAGITTCSITTTIIITITINTNQRGPSCAVDTPPVAQLAVLQPLMG